MMRATVHLAAEDEAGLAVGRKLVAEAPPLSVYREENGRGFGALKRKTPAFQRMAESGFPVLMLTDLDCETCPSKLIAAWLRESPSKGFLFRVCDREVEAWLLSHRAGLAGFFRIAESLLPRVPHELRDPKAELIRLAQRAPRQIRDGITPVGSATIGPNYNLVICDFVKNFWSPEVAATASPSLARTRVRIKELAQLTAY